MAKSKKKPVAPTKSKPAAKKPGARVTQSSPKSKSKPDKIPVRKQLPKPKLAKQTVKPVKSPVKPTKAAPAGKPAKPAAKPANVSKKTPAKTIVPVKSSKSSLPTTKAAPAAKASNSKPVPVAPLKNAPAKPVSAKSGGAPNAKVGSTREKLRNRILAQKTKPAKPVAFSFEEIRELAKTAAKSSPLAPSTATQSAPAAKSSTRLLTTLDPNSFRSEKPTLVKAASLADILGFNPKKKASHAESEEALIPEKFKRYYKLLIELRNHVTGQVDQHSEETLKRSAKEDSGDLSSYGTDGGTDSFDRDFALSLVANEQEALAEVEAAIQRIKHGSYGVCEHTQKPILKERLLVVPFTRYTAEALKEIEKTRYKVRGQTGILGEGEEGTKMEDDSGGDE